MPGEASLRAGQYYAHPRNAFWLIMEDIFGPAGPVYSRRLALLKRNGVALWDVLGSCVRPGSSDAAIRRSSIRHNDIAGFLSAHPGIERVVFNGSKAEECFRRRVLPDLPVRFSRLEYLRLPSTSPAYASVPYSAKLSAWRRALTRE